MKNFFILVAIALSGCAALPPEIGDSQRDISFRKGEFRLECRGAMCGGRWGANKRTAKRLHDSGQWRELADLVTKTGYDRDLPYFFLGSAAMGLGYSDASKIYFKIAIEHRNKCSGVLDVCSGFDVPELSQQALNRLLSSIPPVAQAPRQAEPVAQGSVQSALPHCNPNVAATSWTNCQGTGSDANGTKYVGEHRDGKPHGQGTYTWANGDKYVGESMDGKRSGQGTYYYLADNQFKGDMYVGEYRDGKRNGQGTYTYGNGEKYVGEWRDSKRNGQGTNTFADGRPPVEGVWENNNFVRAQRIPDHIAGRSAAQPDRGQQTTGGLTVPPVALPQSNIDVARKKCEELGLKSGTEKFGECVLRLSK